MPIELDRREEQRGRAAFVSEGGLRPFHGWYHLPQCSHPVTLDEAASLEADSNCRPPEYHTGALPLELSRLEELGQHPND